MGFSPYSVLAANPVSYVDPNGADTFHFTRTIVTKEVLDESHRYPSIKEETTETGSIEIKKGGPDVFLYTENTLEYKLGGKVWTNTSYTTEFHPLNPNSYSGATSTSYFFGLFQNEDNDQLTLARVAPKSFINYLIKRSEANGGYGTNAYKTALAYQSDYSLFKGLQTVEEAVVSAYGFSTGLRAISALTVESAGKDLFYFSAKAMERMNMPGRQVPVQILEDVIKNTKAYPDPGGSRALMYYEQIFKNGQPYNLEVLYDKESNSIWHFLYSRDAMGPLNGILK